MHNYYTWCVCSSIKHTFSCRHFGYENSKSNEGRQNKNGGVKGGDGNVEDLDRQREAW